MPNLLSRFAPPRFSASFTARNVTTPDKIITDFIRDSQFHDLNLSAIVPTSARFLYIQVLLSATPPGSLMAIFRKKGETGLYGDVMGFSAANNAYAACGGLVELVDQKIQYLFTSNPGWTAIDFTIQGWLT